MRVRDRDRHAPERTVCVAQFSLFVGIICSDLRGLTKYH